MHKPWTDTEDVTLITAWAQMGMCHASVDTGRTEGGCWSRLRLLRREKPELFENLPEREADRSARTQFRRAIAGKGD